MKWLTAIVAALAALVACTSPLATTTPKPSPLPSPTPHAAVSATVLQQTDVPSSLGPCTGSGSIGTYLAALHSTNPTLAAQVSRRWDDLKAVGAYDGAISLFAADPSACSAEFAAAANIKSAASEVIVFGDEGQADRAWQTGTLGFSVPAPNEAPPGISRGVSTGLGESSWIYVQAPVQMAVWRKSVFLAVVVFTNLDAASFKAGAAAVNARLN